MEQDDDLLVPEIQPSARKRIIGACLVAAAYALGAYALIEAVGRNNGLVSFTFLLLTPAALSGFIAYVADPLGRRSLGRYLMVPLWLGLATILVGALVLHEGVICILMLSPLWLGAGLIGAAITHRLRKRLEHGRTYCSVLLLAPLIGFQLEPYIPLPAATYAVTREIVVAAPPEEIWPLLRGIPDVRQGEGTWNFSQDVVGLPRPLGARLVGSGVGAARLASWGSNIRFREVITRWIPDRELGWSFQFDELSGWRFTDRHLMPDSPYFRVTSGGYRMIPIDSNHTRLAIETRYWAKTPVNGYAAIWGERFLGDLEINLLALVKGRAEK